MDDTLPAHSKGRKVLDCLTQTVYPSAFVCGINNLFVTLLVKSNAANTLSTLLSQSTTCCLLGLHLPLLFIISTSRLFQNLKVNELLVVKGQKELQAPAASQTRGQGGRRRALGLQLFTWPAQWVCLRAMNCWYAALSVKWNRSWPVQGICRTGICIYAFLRSNME